MSSMLQKRKGDRRMIQKNIKKPFGKMWRIAAVVMALLMLVTGVVSAADIEDVPYYSYCYWEGPSRYEAVPMRAMYEAQTLITSDSLGIDAMADPTYVCLSADKSTLFILDGNNSRILAVDTATYTLDADYGVNGVIGQVMSEDGPLDYAKATGIYVSKDNEIFIADTENRRVLITDAAGNLVNTLVNPYEKGKNNGVPEDLDYMPSRITMDQKGYLYVVCKGCYYGMLVYDENYNFKSFHGSYAVEQSVTDTLKSWITSLFMTNEKSANQQKKLPAEIQDITIDSDGMLYTLSSGGYGQIKRLGLNGNQTLGYKFGFSSSSGDLINFGENPSSFWYEGYQYQQSLSGIAVDPEGFIYSIDKSRGRVFMYDEECRVISAFSTGFGSSNQVGTLQTPEAIVASSDALYVLDLSTASVTVFKLTEYGRMFKEADLLTMAGEYEQAEGIWNDV